MPFDPGRQADRLLISALRTQRLELRALSALRRATSLLALSFGDHLRQARAAPDPLIRSEARVKELASVLSAASEACAILGDRWEKLPERHRPHYTPAADVVHHLAQTMSLLGFGGDRLVASILTRAGWRVSREWVRRSRKTRGATPEPPVSGIRAVRAKRPNHVWMMDVTEVKGLFALRRFAVATVFDVFSRMPLLTQVFETTPTACETAALFRRAAGAHGPAPHFVSDRGRQFTSRAFKRATNRVGAAHRFGAIGRSGSIALIERFWRSLKEALGLRFAGPLTREDLQRRAAYALAYYAHHRPHQGLGGATPAEVFLGVQPAHIKAVHPPRGRPGESVGPAPFRVDFLDPEDRYPILQAA